MQNAFSFLFPDDDKAVAVNIRSFFDRPTQSKLAGRFYVLAAALMWSSSGLFAKAPIFDDWSSAERGPLLAFWRAVFAALLLFPMVRRPRWRPGLVPLALCFTIMNTAYLTAMSLTTAANTIWLQSTSPLWVFLMAVFIFHEPVVRRDLAPLAFGVVGVGLIIFMELAHGTSTSTVGVFAGLLSGFSYSCVIVGMRALRAENPVWLVALCHVSAATLLLPWVIWIGVWPSFTQLIVLAGFGMIQMAIPYVLILKGLQAVSSQEVVAIGLIEPTFLPVWVYLVWGETPATWTIVGGTLILTGLALRYFVLNRRPPETSVH